ncbi:MAG TPA: serine/threonine-protein kinase [Pirellulales bacterium]|jgi:serine/threonine protein kinase|nr:serine/threonine-protein kinase [Pirellulales bacterium]
MDDSFSFDDAFLARLPLPLAQLFRRALNAKTPLEQHLAASRIAELGVKLLACGAIVEYAALGQPDPQINECLQNLARPSLGHWWEFARRLVPLLADAGYEGYGRLREMLLGRARDDLPRSAGLDAALRESFGQGSGSRTTVRLSELFDRLIQHRNKGQAHAAPEMREDAYHRRFAAAILAGMSEIFARIDLLAGARLVYISEVRKSGGGWLVQQFELAGEHSRRLAPLEMASDRVAELPDAERVYLIRTDGVREKSLPLYPLALYDSDSEELLLLNSRHGKRQVEYLCYTSGRVEKQPAELQGQHAELLARLLKMEVGAAEVNAWAARSQSDEPPVEDAPPSQRTLGEFELLSELGRGGMGVVYRAWQPSLGRQVALKKLVRTGDKSEQRFAREIHALGRVEHPHLVKIYTSGSDGDQWFYAMELVEGAPLVSVCEQLQQMGSRIEQVNRATWRDAVSTACSRARQEERSLTVTAANTTTTTTEHPPNRVVARSIAAEPTEPARVRPGQGYIEQVVELVRQAALAAHALHEAGIVHRDIKPGNVMVTADGEQAVLMDLGLAQLADDEEGRLTRTRQFVGTLRYASPQQVLAAERLDRTSDIYSLGATLWELLCLQPMFGAGEQTPTPTLMERILHDEPAALRRFNPQVSRDLEAVVAHCLEKRPDRRYATARQLADDLERCLRGEPVKVRRASRLERTARWVARRRTLVAACAFATLAVVLLVVGSVVLWRWINTEKDLELERRQDVAADDPTPDVHEVFPDVEQVVQDRKLIAAKPAGWRPPTEADFEFQNSTGEPGLRLLMCNLTDHYNIDEAAKPDDDPFAAAKNEWRTVLMRPNATAAERRISLHVGLGWYAFFVRTPRGDVHPLFVRDEQGEDIMLGETNVFTSKRVVLEITAGQFGGKKRYYATFHREN